MATQLGIYNEALRLLGDIRLATITDDVASRYALDDAYADAITYVLRQAPWRFALVTAALTTSGTPIAGFSISSAKPGTWLRTHAIFVMSGSRQCPIHCREDDILVYSNVTPTMRYVSSNGASPTLWPEQFAKTVSAYIAFSIAERVTGDPDATARMFQIYQQAFAMATGTDAVAEDPWLRFQIDGSFYRGVRRILESGFWRFAIKTVLLQSTRGPELLANPGMSADVSWTKGTGWTWSGGGFRHVAGSAASLTQAEALVSGDRYEVTYVVEGWTAGTHRPRFTGGTTVDGTINSGDGTFTETLISTGNTTVDLLASADGAFYVTSGSVKQITFGAVPSQGYGYAFAKPSDFDRAFHVYRPVGPSGIGQERDEIDFRDEGGFLHANYDPVVLRYLSTDGESATVWSDTFETAVMAYLQYEEAKADPRMAGAQLQTRLAAWEHASAKARFNDDMTERPKVSRTGRLGRARFGSFPVNREQGY